MTEIVSLCPVANRFLDTHYYNNMYVVIASDHAGFNYKTLLLPVLMEAGFNPVDLGSYDANPSDYPDHAKTVAEAIINGKAEKGIIICGSGVGVSIAANKFKGIRAGVCHDTYSAHQSVEHDNANVLCIGERIIGIALMHEICITFLRATFSNEKRHLERLNKIKIIEDENFK
jgi:ribose 5-phosphate isomerase B